MRSFNGGSLKLVKMVWLLVKGFSVMEVEQDRVCVCVCVFFNSSAFSQLC
jgi:hypothetical protein